MPDDSTLPAVDPTRPVLTTEEVVITTTPPTPSDPPPPPSAIPDTTDIPPPPGSDLTDTTIPAGGPTINTSPSLDLPPIIGAPPKKKFGGKKVISTILGLLLLIGGIGAGVTLVKQQQDIREKAGGVDTKCGPAPTKFCPSGELCHELSGWCVPKSAYCPNTDCGLPSGVPGAINGCVLGTIKFPQTTNCCPASKPSYNSAKNICEERGGGGGSGGGGSGGECSDSSAARCQGEDPGFVCDNDPPGSGVCTVKGDGSEGKDEKPVCICKRSDGGGGPTCKEECPSPDGILRNCTPPEADGTPEELICNKVGKIEACGGKSYCCPAAGGKWTTNMSACEGSGQCNDIKAYDTSWKRLKAEDLGKLKAGDKVRFTVKGSESEGTAGNFNKAKFKINSTNSGEVTQQKPESNEFYYEYTIPEGTTSFSITAQIHHTVLGWSK